MLRRALVILLSAAAMPCMGQDIVLPEIHVKARMPGMKIHGDTIAYNHKQYTDGTEKMLADVLGKLPGM